MDDDTNVRSAAQKADCGSGSDAFSADSDDVVTGCERLRLTAACSAPCTDTVLVEHVDKRGRRKVLLRRNRRIGQGGAPDVFLPLRLRRMRKLAVVAHAEDRRGRVDHYVGFFLARRI